MAYDEILKTSANIFSKYYIIDIFNDKTLEYDNKYNLINEITFYDFVENSKKTIHPDDINKYFDFISLKKLEEEKNKGNNTISCSYKKIVNNKHKEYLSLIKLLDQNDNKYVIIFETDLLLDKDNNKILENSYDKEKIKIISDRVTDVIFKIFNTINVIDDKTEIFQMKNALEYITNILNNLVKEVPELNKGLESQMISEVNKNKPTLLIADDDLMTRNLIKKAFKDEYEILMASNGQIAIDILEKNSQLTNTEVRDNIVGIFLDLAMPVLDGFAVLDYLKINNILNKIPVIIISAAEEKETRQKVYQYGIADMIEKPFNLELIKYRTDNFINLYKTSNSLDELISKKNNNVDALINKIKEAYLNDNELKINYIKKISNYFLNKLIEEYPEYRINNDIINKIIIAITYYDIGTYLLPKNIDKTNEEYLKHIELGYEYIETVLKKILDKDIYNYSLEICKYHHEKYDGTGIHKIAKDDIPIYIQIIILSIECSEMLIEKKSLNELHNKITNEKNKKYNPLIVDIFEKYYRILFK